MPQKVKMKNPNRKNPKLIIISPRTDIKEISYFYFLLVLGEDNVNPEGKRNLFHPWITDYSSIFINKSKKVRGINDENR